MYHLRRRATLLLSALLLACTGLVASSTVANAATAPSGTGYWDHTVVRVKARYYNQVDFNHQIARVYQQPGQTASIASGKTATRTIQVGGGMTRSGIAANLSISSATSVTVTVGCNSVIPKGNTYLAAYPVGTQIYYEVVETWVSTPSNKRTEFSSGLLMAFNPTANQIYCHTY
ncbi:hypothetical protein [Cellulomonas sp.]|uniref:hypothetical protein n=1 Tax=Cellulomonas sp. TaxID=40001 RepID=UPI001B087B58|nr:hypothetical protein [Cellulomonas sp.]MBO9554891.1 hypothetical protein [Cellulomonas sp.]